MLISEVTTDRQPFVNGYRQSGTIRRTDGKLIIQILIKRSYSQNRIKQLVLEPYYYIGSCLISALYHNLYPCFCVCIHKTELESLHVFPVIIDQTDLKAMSLRCIIA